MDYRLIRSNRKTVSLIINREGELVVRAPKNIAKRQIDLLVGQKQDWIVLAKQKAEQNKARKSEFFVSDGILALFGQEKRVIFDAQKQPFYSQTDSCFHLAPAQEEQLRRQAETVYRRLARVCIEQKVRDYAQMLQVTPTAVRINGAKTRWGSCSGKNSLNFSWRLMLAPEPCVDYVVVHELCHILHHDHSPAFWQEVERVVPDRKLRQQQLRETALKRWFFTE